MRKSCILKFKECPKGKQGRYDSYLKKVAKATEVVSTYDCMPIIYLQNYSKKEEDEDNRPNPENFKLVEGVDENGDEFSYYELDTTKL